MLCSFSCSFAADLLGAGVGGFTGGAWCLAASAVRFPLGCCAAFGPVEWVFGVVD